MLRFKKFILIVIILSVVFVISQRNNLPFSKYTSPKNRAYERSLVDDFITYAMIRYFGIYTLFEVKPVTEIDTQYQPPTEEERKQVYEGLTSQEKKEILYEDFILKSPWGSSTKEQWEAFKNELKNIDLKDHFFVETRYNYEDKEFNSLLFVHRSSLIKLLNFYHDRFEKQIGKFDSAEKVDELKNGGSKFWDKIFKEKNHYLMGLVLGFGEKNSRLFDEEFTGNKKNFDQRVDHSSLSELKKILKDDVSIEDLCIPQFISYQKQDEVVNAYMVSRKKIIEQLKGKDLTKEVFVRLRDGTKEHDQDFR